MLFAHLTPKMQPSPKQYADYLRLGLFMGLCTQADAIAWADSQLTNASTLPDWLTELSTGKTKHPLDIIHSLNQVPGPADHETSHRLLIAQLGQRYPVPLVLNNPAAMAHYHHLIWSLYNSMQDSELTTELTTLLLQIDDILCWIGHSNLQDDSEKGWILLRQNHRDLIAHGEAYRSYLHCHAEALP